MIFVKATAVCSCNSVPDFVALLKLEYISEACCFKVEVKFYNNDMTVWKEHTDMFGEYELVTGTVNGKPHYSSEKYGIWQSATKQFVIGLTGDLGSMNALASNANTAQGNCPYEPAFDWSYKDVSGAMRGAGVGLTVSCNSYTVG